MTDEAWRRDARRALEEQLEENEARYAAIINGSLDAIIAMDSVFPVELTITRMRGERRVDVHRVRARSPKGNSTSANGRA